MPKKNSRWVRIGSQIRSYRDQAGLSQDELSKTVALSPTMLSAMERGARGVKREHAARIDQALGTGGVLVELWDRSSASALPPWYQDAAELERAASEIWEYHPLLIPGVLQTEDYARHLLTIGLPRETPSAVDDLVQARIGRQARLTADDPPTWVFVLDEAVLRRPTGGRTIMFEQLSRLCGDSSRPNIAVHIVPFETTHHPGLSNAFALFRVPESGTVLYVEARQTGTATGDAHAVDDYSRLFGDLRGAALPLEASRQLIAETKEQFS